ncbi:uncharacterized protein isoform X3 [Rhodnius prolixus]|uniref:uncharacterized protein isoform X3 n=1 Tax=Rhodnius prolixus TaxID=13249 RepID=UPI003D18D33F
MASLISNKMAPKEEVDEQITKDKSSQCTVLRKNNCRYRKKGKFTRNSSRLLDKLRKRLPKRRQDDCRKVFPQADMERALSRWFSRRSNGNDEHIMVPTVNEVIRKAVILSKRYGADETDLKLYNERWAQSWLKRFTGAEAHITNKIPVEEKLPTLEFLLDGYNDDQIYTGLGFEFDWTSLPDRSLTRRTPEERVWLLMAGNKSGRHRTRMLITGKEWRPESLKHVNMLSQPVVYAGGGVGRLTPDLFSWWFHREFAPAALVLNETGAVLVMERADYLPSPAECVAADGKVKLVIYSSDNSATLKLDQSVLKCELKSRYAMLLLHNLSIEQPRWLSVTHFLREFSLKEAFPLLHRAWLNVRPESFTRCWSTSITSLQAEEDRFMLLELQWLSHDIGFEVTDEDVRVWASCDFDVAPEVKSEPREENRDLGANDAVVPTAAEAASHLAKALLWMESEPIEPSYLLVLRDIITIAKQASKMGHPGSGLPFFCHNGDTHTLSQPPPAHMGIPPYQLDPKGGLTRPPMYPFATGQYPYPMLGPEISQVAASWHTPSMYPISGGSAGFRSPYPTSLPITSTNIASDFYRFSPTGLMGPHPGLSPHSHPAIVTPGPKQELQTNEHNHRPSSMDHKSSSSTNEGSKSQDSGHTSNNQEKKKPHIKKPLNAFMLYMKEMRAKVVAECTLKESAAINQILGRRWHSLSREEQAKYYEKARIERQLHMELYPGWSARDNYGYGAKKKKRKKERVTITDSGGNSMKKCRARYGLDQQSQWCKPCRRKKKCIRYKECGDDSTQSEDNLGSCGSVGDDVTSPAADDDLESYGQSSSSPGGLSGLSSLASPSVVLASPSASLASPSVSLASPAMSLQSPLTPQHDYDIKPAPPPPPPLPPTVIPPQLLIHLPPLQMSTRHPVGTNPHDVNNPLSVNQLTGKCVKGTLPTGANNSGGHHTGTASNNSPPPPRTSGGKEPSRTVISVP